MIEMPDRVILIQVLLPRYFLNKITIYDSLFIAASERETVALLTTDGKLYEKVNSKRNVNLIKGDEMNTVQTIAKNTGVLALSNIITSGLGFS